LTHTVQQYGDWYTGR